MRKSDKLRNRKEQHKPKNTLSQYQENILMQVVLDIETKLQQDNKDLVFFHEKTFTCKDLGDNLPESPKNDDSSIKPDGGFIYVKINDKKHCILVSEQKTQGTNDKRLAEGQKKQAKGNAVERLGKNVKFFDFMFKDEDIYPFVCFLQGCDFNDSESTIGDRVRTINLYQNMNKINLYWQSIGKHVSTGGSFFMRGHSMNETPGTSDWTYDEMYEVCYEIATKSLNYYRTKYIK